MFVKRNNDILYTEMLELHVKYLDVERGERKPHKE